MFMQISAFRVFTLIILLACCANAYSQTSGVTAFHQRFVELREQVKAEAERIKKLNLQDSTATNQASEDLVKLLSQVNQLKEESFVSYQHTPTDEQAKFKPARFVSQGCFVLMVSINALGNYVATGDATFLDLYRDSGNLVAIAEKGM